MPIQPVKTQADFDRLLAASLEKPVFLFKHSSTCPVSAEAMLEFMAWIEQHPGETVFMNLVIEDRPLARKLAVDIGVPHQSPQAILFHRGKPVWNASHHLVEREKLESAFKSAA